MHGLETIIARNARAVEEYDAVLARVMALLLQRGLDRKTRAQRIIAVARGWER